MLMNGHIEDGEVSRHKCLIYDGDPAEQLPVVVPFLIDGLRHNWRCLYLGSPQFIDLIESELVARGVDSIAENQRGALVYSTDRLEGGFEPRAMVDMLAGQIDDAVRAGFQGLCATGDMAWELCSEENFERLLEYEALLEKLFREKPFRGICLYRSSAVPPHALQDALLAHRSLYLVNQLNRDNFFYMPPEVLLSREQDRDKLCQWMCDQLIRVQTAERQRDEAVAALKNSESHHRRIENEVLEMNRDLEQRMRQRTSELEAANKELHAFSASVAHDLRAPLRHIDHYVSKMQQGTTDTIGQDATEWLERIRTSTSHMNALITGLLNMATVDRQEMRCRSIDLSRLCESVAKQLRQEEPYRQVEFSIQPGLFAYGDTALLLSVLENLIGNAWKFTSKRAHARIEFAMAGEDSDQAVFRLSDNGAGFAPGALPRMFGLFQRLHLQSEFPGVGIGLVTVQRIIRRHGGSIWAEGVPDEGATFFFSLPIKAPRESQLRDAAEDTDRCASVA